MTTKLTEKIFRAVKIMTTGGATAHEISDCFGISITTVNRVRGAESIEEYRTMLAADYGKKKKGKAAPVNPEPVKAPVSQQMPATQLPQPEPLKTQITQLGIPQLRLPQHQTQQPQSLQSQPEPQAPQTQSQQIQPQLQPQPQSPQSQSQQIQSQPLPLPQPPQPTQVIEHRQTVTVQATHYMMQEMKKTNELLDLISRKLTFIVDSLT